MTTNTLLRDNSTVVYYALAVNGRIVTARFATPFAAEAARAQIPPEQQALAEVVTVDSLGRQLLLG